MITEPIEIFLSSTYKDLVDERSAIERQINRLKQTFLGMEYFAATEETPLEISIGALEKSDIAIFIIGHRYGSIDTRSGKSIVEIEYITAVQNKKFIMVYLKDESVPILPNHFESDPGAYKKLIKFKDKLKRKHHVVCFKTPEDLAANVSADLVNVLHKRGRWKELSLAEVKTYESFWNVLDKLTIVIEAGKKHAPHPGELEFAKNINGVFGLLTLIPVLSELGIDYTIENSLDRYLNKTGNLLLDGSFGGNELTKEVVNHPKVKEKLVFCNVYSRDKYTRWIEEIKTKKKCYETIYEKGEPMYQGGPSKHIVYDYGFLAKITNPFNSSKICLICSGNHGAGTYACMKFLASPQLMVPLVKKVGIANFQAVIGIRPLGLYHFKTPELKNVVIL